jgi:type IV pilus assembly protein PilQ
VIINKWAKWASCMAVLSLLAASCGSQVAETRQDQQIPTDNRAVLKDVTFQEKDGEVSIHIDTSRKVTYSLYQQQDPLRLILDLPQTSTGAFTENIPVNSGTVSFIKPVVRDRGNSHLAFFLTAPSIFDVDGQGNRVKLKISGVEKKEDAGPAGVPAAVVTETPTLRDEPIESRPIVEETVRAPEPKALLVTAKAAVADPPPEPSLDKAEFVTALNVEKGPSGTLATIEGDGTLQYEYFLVEGKSLVIDIFNAGNKIWPTVYRVQGPFVEQVRIGEHFQPDKKVRVVFDLKNPGDYSVTKGANRILVAFGEVEEQPAAAAGGGSVNTVEDVYFRPLDGKSRVEIKTSGEPEFKVVDSEDPLRLIVEVGNARIEPAAQKTMDLSRLNRAVDKVTAFQYTKEGSSVVRVVVQLREAAPFRVAAAGKSIAIDINGLSGPASSSGGTAAAAPAPVESAAPVAPAAAVPQMPADGPKVYTGKRLSLDFIDADINDILRLIADVSGLNFVSGPEVKGKVTIRLADVPWDQALDIILKTNVPPLAQIYESDTIVRVTTLGKIQEEHEAMRRAAEQEVKNLEAQKKLEPLVTQSFQISYANINNIQKIMREFTSDRVDQDGLITVDERTGTIIVRDLQENVDEIARTIEALDSPTPAVVVEARIVEMSSSALKELGVQWNLNFSADPAHGNALPFAFPNSLGVNGGVGTGEGGGSGGYMVNLPAEGATSGIGISFGHIASTLSLDLRLTAMEQMGKTKILSTPRVLVVQNEEARINVGQELPIPSTDAEGNRTVTWRAVGINLTVKPQVTNDGRVFMKIRVAKESQGDPVATTEGLMFSINSNKAETQVLIADGETAVIGGLTEEGTQESEAGTPGLSSIPGIGWLFRSRANSTIRKELMIFLTPKIVSVL